MQLSDFSYTVTSKLLEYSHEVPRTIALFNRDYSSSNETIFQVPCCGLSPEEDRLEYWDSGKASTYGRYLLFKNTTTWEITKFWTGFNDPPLMYCIWFKEEWLTQSSRTNIKNNHSNAKFENGEVWIPMRNPDITDQTLKDFWHSVLKELK
jgi:hypothetical protein